MRKWQQANPDKVRGYSRKYYNLNREKEIARNVKGNINRYRKMRLDAIIRYGGDPPKCCCCGEQEYLFLTIHHIQNDGAEHRRAMKKKYTWGIYEYLRRHHYPEGYSVLCYNCNCAKGYYGRCPHGSNIEEKGYPIPPASILSSKEAKSLVPS